MKEFEVGDDVIVKQGEEFLWKNMTHDDHCEVSDCSPPLAHPKYHVKMKDKTNAKAHPEAQPGEYSYTYRMASEAVDPKIIIIP